MQEMWNQFVYYLREANEVLRSADGVTFAVCSQWGIGNTPRVAAQARKLGYSIATSGEASAPE